jgi:hypothetical protein
MVAVKLPSMVAVPCEKNCTVLPSVSAAVTPLRLTVGSVTPMLVSAFNTR